VEQLADAFRAGACPRLQSLDIEAEESHDRQPVGLLQEALKGRIRWVKVTVIVGDDDGDGDISFDSDDVEDDD